MSFLDCYSSSSRGREDTSFKSMLVVFFLLIPFAVCNLLYLPASSRQMRHTQTGVCVNCTHEPFIEWGKELNRHNWSLHVLLFQLTCVVAKQQFPNSPPPSHTYVYVRISITFTQHCVYRNMPSSFAFVNIRKSARHTDRMGVMFEC